MNEHAVRQMFESYAEIAATALREGKHVEFQEVTTRGGTVLLVCKIDGRRGGDELRGPNSA